MVSSSNFVLNDWRFKSLEEDTVVGVLETGGFPRTTAGHFLQVYGSKVVLRNQLVNVRISSLIFEA